MNEQDKFQLRLLQRWRDREQLDLMGWTDLYQLAWSACARAMPGDGEQALFARFFARRVVEATASELQSAAQLSVLLGWFCATSGEGASSLDEVEEALFRPSDAICLDLAAGRVDAGDMELDEVLESRVAELRAAAAEHVSLDLSAVVDVRTQVQDYLRRKLAARAAAGPVDLSAGAFVRLERLLGPGEEDGELLARPLYALIDSATEVPDVWWGWMAGGEPELACEWDVLVDASDEQVDPIIANVQLWNPVRIYAGTVSAMAGRLSASRHAAVRALAADFVSGTVLPAVGAGSAAQVGESVQVARETRAGLALKTGPALTAVDDPRWTYQRLFLTVAEAAGTPAVLATEALETTAWLVTASVQQVSTALFAARATDGSGRQLEVDFQMPMVIKPVLLIQTRAGQRLDDPISLQGNQIAFVGGLATPPAELVAVLACVLRLPDVFANWPAVASDFREHKRRTTGLMRAALKAFQAAIDKMGRPASDVSDFLFPQLSGAARSNRSGSGMPVVDELTSEADGRTRLGLFWIGQEPEYISSVELQFIPEGPAMVTDAQWVHARRVVDFRGHRISHDAFAAATFKDGVLKIEVRTSPEGGDAADKQ